MMIVGRSGLLNNTVMTNSKKNRQIQKKKTKSTNSGTPSNTGNAAAADGEEAWIFKQMSKSGDKHLYSLSI